VDVSLSSPEERQSGRSVLLKDMETKSLYEDRDEEKRKGIL
jgi:hypothetical protein